MLVTGVTKERQMEDGTKCSQLPNECRGNTELFNMMQSSFGQEARIDEGMEERKNQMGYINDPNTKEVEKLKEPIKWK